MDTTLQERFRVPITNVDFFGETPPGLTDKKWRELMTDEALRYSRFNTKFRQSTGAREAFQWADEKLRKRYVGT